MVTDGVPVVGAVRDRKRQPNSCRRPVLMKLKKTLPSTHTWDQDTTESKYQCPELTDAGRGACSYEEFLVVGGDVNI
jgi:hypothetical protein